MKILLCSLTYPLPNGVTTSINSSVEGLVAHGHEVKIVGPEYGENGHSRPRPEYFSVSSSRIMEVLTSPLGNKERTFGIKAQLELSNLIKNFNPDILWLHTVTWAPNIFELLMTRSPKAKVLTYHTTVDQYGKMYGGALAEQHMINRSVDVCDVMDQVIAPSNFIKNRLISFGVTTPIAVIPTGISTNESAPDLSTKKSVDSWRAKYGIESGQKVLLSVGRVVKEKNISALLKMVKILADWRDDILLILVGPGDIKNTQSEAKKLGIDKNIIFTDKVSNNDIEHYYRSADIFVFASQSESQGLVVGEAMAHGLPVVALRSPIQPEFYPEDVALVGDNPRELARSVVKLLDDPELYETTSNKSEKFVRQYLSKEKMTEAQIHLFNQLLGAKVN